MAEKTAADSNEEDPRMEQMRDINHDIAQLLAPYGCTPDEYWKHYPSHMVQWGSGTCLPLPPDTVDVREWLKRIEKIERDNDALRRMKEMREEALLRMKELQDMIGSPAFGGRGSAMRGDRTVMELYCKIRDAEREAAGRNLWNHVFNGNFIDADEFRAHMGALLEARLRLGLELRKAEAERLIAGKAVAFN